MHTVEEWNQMTSEIAASLHGMIVLKFSPRCPISRSVEREFDAWCEALPDAAGVVCCKVNVVHSKPLSQHIAAHFDVRHESPQAIWLSSDLTVRWHASHYAVTKRALADQLQSAP